MFEDYKVAYMRKRVKVREKRKQSFLRVAVGYALSESARKIPHAAMTTEFDVTPLVEYGKTSEKAVKEGEGVVDRKTLLKRAIRKNYSAFFIKAIGHAVYNTPCMNGFLDYTPFRNGGGYLYVAEDVNMSFTVHTKYGVIKPVIKNPHLKDLETVATEMRQLARKARRTDCNMLYYKIAKAYLKEGIKQLDWRGLGAMFLVLRAMIWDRPKPDPEFADIPEDQQLQVEDVLGATCTIANIGMMAPGHQTVTVIIPPEVMMFGIGNLRHEAKVVNGEVLPRYAITLCSTMDHRAFDAGEAFGFGEYITRYIENPELIYEWKEGDEI